MTDIERILPFTALLHPDGRLEPGAITTTRLLSDMRAHYASMPAGRQDAAIYRVHALPVPETHSEIQCSTTVILPGTVGEEYFMTKGHFHQVRDRAEVYVGLSGEGLLLLAAADGNHRVEKLAAGTVNYIPGGWAHRSVNTGTEPLVFFAAYVGDAGHDYVTIEERDFPVRFIHTSDGPRVVPNARYRG